MYRFSTILLILLVPLTVLTQRWDQKYWGLQIGVVTTFGTHTNNIGIKFQAYGMHEFVQLNSGLTVYYNALNLGSRIGYSTVRINSGIALMGGKQTANPHITLSGLNTQSAYQYALAYNYLWYFDNAGTSQRSGGMAVHIDDFSLYIENDFFSGQGLDQFRTSNIALMYHTDLLEIYLENTLWTGKTQNTPRKISTITSNNKLAYKDLTESFLGKTSSGIIAVGFNHLIHSGNIVGLSLGYDSELIRNSIQNKFMHDKKFIPASIRKQNPHYPILNEEGTPTFINKERKKDQFFFSGGLNQNLGY